MNNKLQNFETSRTGSFDIEILDFFPRWLKIGDGGFSVIEPGWLPVVCQQVLESTKEIIGKE